MDPTQNTVNTQGTQAGQKDDYLDKGEFSPTITVAELVCFQSARLLTMLSS